MSETTAINPAHGGEDAVRLRSSAGSSRRSCTTTIPVIIRGLGMCLGGVLIGVGIFELFTVALSPATFLNAVDNLFLGLLIILAELRWTIVQKWCRLLSVHFGLGGFYAFVGTVAMGDSIEEKILAVAFCVVGIFYILQGCMCAEPLYPRRRDSFDDLEKAAAAARLAAAHHEEMKAGVVAGAAAYEQVQRQSAMSDEEEQRRLAAAPIKQQHRGSAYDSNNVAFEAQNPLDRKQTLLPQPAQQPKPQGGFAKSAASQPAYGAGSNPFEDDGAFMGQ